MAKLIKCTCGHVADTPKKHGTFRCSKCGARLTLVPDGHAEGSDDIQHWAMRRLDGQSGVTQDSRTPNMAQKARLLLRNHPESLTIWERNFLTNVSESGWRGGASAKQIAVMTQIAARLKPRDPGLTKRRKRRDLFKANRGDGGR
jgi:hypothetical protein